MIGKFGMIGRSWSFKLQSRYNRGRLSLIFGMDFQFLAIWAAQGSTYVKKEKIWADYEQLLRAFFYVFMGKCLFKI